MNKANIKCRMTRPIQSAIALLILTCTSSFAAPLTWTLNNVVFSHDSFAFELTGSFVFDAEARKISSMFLEVETLNTSFIPIYADDGSLNFNSLIGTEGATELQWTNPGPIRGLVFEAIEPCIDILSCYVWAELHFDSALTGHGGEKSLQANSRLYGISSPVFIASPDYFVVSGTVSAVPIPAAAWLFGSALLGLGWIKRSSREK